MSHDRARGMVEDLRQCAEAVHHARRVKHGHRQAFERCSYKVAQCHESLGRHNAVNAGVKTWRGWMQKLHELRMNLEHAQKNQNHEFEMGSRANAHIANALNQFSQQQARVEMEYYMILRRPLPPQVKHMIARVYNPR